MNKKRHITPLLLLFSISHSQEIIGEGLAGQPLLDYVVNNYKTSTTLGYNTARDTLYSIIDLQEGNQLSCVYSGYTITLDTTQDPSTNAYNQGINCEHTYPQSMGASEEPQKSDMHHLFPCKSNVNSSRGNDPYAEIPDEETDTWYRNDYSQDTIPTEYIDEFAEKDNPPNPNNEVFEPRENHKGDASRAVFYFFAMYNDVADTNFWNIQRDILLDWHYYDEVDDWELNRTWDIASYQENQPNPFVLDSSLARRIWYMDDGGTDTSNTDTTEYNIIINEIMQNPLAVGDSEGEWFEIYNNSDEVVDLNGFIIKDNGTDSHLITQETLIASNGYAVMGRNSDYNSNGGLELDYQYENFTLANGSDEILLIDLYGNTVDSVAYDGGSTFPDPNGSTMALLELNLDNNMGGNWVEYDSLTYGDGDYGTPGQENFPIVIEGSVINVPGDQPTIQDAINVAVSGDTVLVQPGIYYEHINYLGKNIVIGSLMLMTGDTTYIHQTIIDGNEDDGSVVTFENGEDTTAVLIGFSITNGNAVWDGGGINCIQESSPKLLNLEIFDNQAQYQGGGISCWTNSSAIIENVNIFNNVAYNNGGGIFCNENSNIRLINSSITNNIASYNGGGIEILYSFPTIINVTIANNSTVQWSGGGIHCDNSSPEILNSVFWGNSPSQIHTNNDSVFVSYSNIAGGWYGTGNINSSPLFCEPFDNNFKLAENSPCLGTGFDGSNMGAFGVGCSALYNGSLWYVSNSGSNSNGDGSETNPLETIQYAVNMANDGDSVIVNEGVYYEEIHAENRDLTIGSLYMFDNNDESIIENTILDGENSHRLYNLDNAQVYLIGMTMQNGFTENWGGAISGGSGDLTIRNCRFTENYAGNSGGVMNLNGENLIISNSVFYNNSSASASVINVGNRTDTERTINVSIKESVFRENTGERRGSINVWGSDTTIVNNCEFIENISGRYGGGFIVHDTKYLEIDSCTINENKSLRGGGGGLNIWSIDEGIISNSIFSGNIVMDTTETDTFRGGGIHLWADANVTIRNCTITNNAAPLAGAIAIKHNSHCTIVNSIIWGNGTTNQIGIYDDLFDEDTTSTLNISFSNLQYGIDSIFVDEMSYIDGYDESSMLNSSPLFCNPDSSDYTLAENSPCVGSGENDANMGALGIGCDIQVDWDFSLSEPVIEVMGADDEWNPGDTISIEMDFCNNTDVAHNWYPGVTIESDSSLTSLHSGHIWFYAIFADTCHTISFSVLANSSIIADTIIAFRAYPEALNCQNQPEYCIDGDTLTFEVPIVVDVVSAKYEDFIPEVYALHQNYPNPFNPITTLLYDLPEDAMVNITIYDMMGRVVNNLVSNQQNAGYKSIQWNATNNIGQPVSAGLYLYTIEAGDFRQTRKMILLK